MTDTLHSSRLVLRPFTDKDAEPVTKFIGNLDVSRWLTHVPYPYALTDAQWFIENEQRMPGVSYAIDLDGTFIGAVSHGETLGYWIAQPHWGNGYASEASRRLIEHRFDNGATQIESGYHLGNAASCNVLTKLRFVPSTQEIVYSRSLKHHVILQRMRLSRVDWEVVQ